MVAWRYIRARRAEGGVSVMTWISLIGVTLAVFALIATLAVRSGFRAEFVDTILGANAHVTIYQSPEVLASGAQSRAIGDYAAMSERLAAVPGVQASVVSPVTNRATVTLDPAQVTFDRLAEAIRDAGYDVPEVDPAAVTAHKVRRGCGNIAVEPRAYQLVPLLMALRLPVVRLLIADDVGIGKTIEAGLIVRELLDRGEITRCAILCPPHLVDQWQGELENRFHIRAIALTSASASRVERSLPPGVSLFDQHPFVVVSLD
jgi:copper chaperone CopZ